MWRGEGVAVFVVGISAGALVALKPCDGGRDDDVRHGNAGKETRLVERTVRLEFGCGKKLVVDADSLYGAVQIALLSVVGVRCLEHAADAERLRADGCGIGAFRGGCVRRGLERCLAGLVVHGRQILAAPVIQADIGAERRLEHDPVAGAVGIEVALVVRDTEKRRIFRCLLGRRHVTDDLNREDVAGIDGLCQYAVFAAAEHIAVIRPFARDARTGDVPESRFVPLGQIDPRRRIAVVGLRHADVADAVQLQEQIASRGVVGRLVQQPRIHYRRNRRHKCYSRNHCRL